MYNIVKRYPTQEMDTNLSYTLPLTMPANLLDTNAKKDNLTKNRISLTNHERGSQYTILVEVRIDETDFYIMKSIICAS